MVAATGEHGALLLVSVLLDRAMTEEDLVRALGDLGLVASQERVRALLTQLVTLGLARLVSSDGTPARYVATVLGRKRVAAVEAGTALQGQLAELEQLRTDLISAVAHELR